MDPLLQELHDRQSIVDCLHRYARGVDRLDRELVRSAYHEDAMDYHAAVFTGGPDEFVEWFWGWDQERRETTQHYITNVAVDLDGDQAHVESYFIAITQMRGEEKVAVMGGRYVDRFERRDGEWRIALRHAVLEWGLTGDAGAYFPAPAGFRLGSRRDSGDISYQRPLGPREG